MKVTAAILVSAFIAATSWAAPHGYDLEARAAAQNAKRITHPRIPVSGPATNSSNVQYSSNWSGGVLTAPPAGQTFTGVSAQFTVPVPSSPNGQAAAASAWVGIDGDTYQNAILQTGVDFNVASDGTVSYDCWYEWYPNFAFFFSGISISAGDVIFASVSSSSSSSGTATIKNLSNGQSVSTTLSAPNPTATLGGQNAEWIVEDFEEGGGLVNFANFGTVDFVDAVATASASTEGTSGATIIDIEQNGQVLTNVDIPNNSEVSVTYV